MANRSFLVAQRTPDPNEPRSEHGVIAAANYCVPAFWLTLFRAEDLTHRDEPELGPAGNTPKVPCAVAATARALARAKAQRAAVLDQVPARFAAHFDEFLQLIERVPESTLRLDVGEIWGMQDVPQDFAHQLARALAAPESQDPLHWVTAFSLAGFDIDGKTQAVDFDNDSARFLLRGYKWQRPVPWQD
ncbi:MAG TPA: hypothetical protein VG269_27550 [Tepidisphaeraceae bacterium]|jgi:hypothetical protein|nr:hypothetical protein [Tepidisphaeraceae bacterium]